MEDRAVGLEIEAEIAPPAADVTRLGDGGADLAGLRAGRPERRADVHRGELAVGALERVGQAGLLVFLGEPRVEHAAEVDVAGVAAGGDDDALLGLDGDVAAFGLDHDALHLSAFGLVAHDLRHLMLEQDLRALLARAFGETADQPRAVAVAPRRDHLARDVPFVGDEHPRHGRGVRRDDRLLDEGHAVVEQELEGRNAFIGERAHQIAVVVAAVAAPVIDPIGENLLGAVLDVEFLLQGVAAAEMDAAAAQHGMPADVVILLDDDDRGAVVARRHGGGEACGARADDHDISRKIPFHPGKAALKEAAS